MFFGGLLGRGDAILLAELFLIQNGCSLLSQTLQFICQPVRVSKCQLDLWILTKQCKMNVTSNRCSAVFAGTKHFQRPYYRTARPITVSSLLHIWLTELMGSHHCRSVCQDAQRRFEGGFSVGEGAGGPPKDPMGEGECTRGQERRRRWFSILSFCG